ncbi:MAG: hypothetical protein OXI54_00685 [Chloroflexota bacterium]|nr:hypothetical protein [Chloroflexota bacterium]MDE2682656.1 hypothetical protein [Chloroflexota bacterium]
MPYANIDGINLYYIAATNRYHMKSTFYAAHLLEFIARVEARQTSAAA